MARLLAPVFALLFLSRTTDAHGGCGTKSPDPSVKEAAEQFVQNKLASALFSAEELTGGMIRTVFHVICGDNQKPRKCGARKRHIREQMEILNRDYNATGFSFKLQGINYWKNSSWLEVPFADEGVTLEMMEALHKDVATTLNVYLVDDIEPIEGEEFVGYASFPWNYSELDGDGEENEENVGDGEKDYRHGIVMVKEQLPPQKADNTRTLVHEVGHYLGLYHTFEGGCSDEDNYDGGDRIDDTPTMDKPSRATCEDEEEEIDSCPDDPGLDPIHNFMDYSNEVNCYREFTPGQIKRMLEQTNTLKPSLLIKDASYSNVSTLHLHKLHCLDHCTSCSVLSAN
jgi:hypothetical protein